jgi:hypothetical protein
MTALDRDSQIAKFSYGQFAIVEATDTQSKSIAARLTPSPSANFFLSTAEYSESTAHPTPPIEDYCSSYPHEAFDSRQTLLRSARSGIHIDYVSIFNRDATSSKPRFQRSEGQCGLELGFKQDGAAQSASYGECRCSVHNDNQRVSHPSSLV